MKTTPQIYRTPTPDCFRAQSFTSNDSYLVRLNAPAFTQALCECPHNTAQAATCKHIAAVLQRLAIRLPQRMKLPAGSCYTYAPESGAYLCEDHHSNAILTAWHALPLIDQMEVLIRPMTEDEYITAQIANQAKFTIEKGIARDMAGNTLALNVDPAKHLARHLHISWNRSRPVFGSANLLKHDEASPFYEQSRPPRYIPTARYLAHADRAGDAIAITLHNLQSDWATLSQSA